MLLACFYLDNLKNRSEPAHYVKYGIEGKSSMTMSVVQVLSATFHLTSARAASHVWLWQEQDGERWCNSGIRSSSSACAGGELQAQLQPHISVFVPMSATCAVSVCLRSSPMDRIRVQCVGNGSKQYDGKVWLERLQDIIEVNGRQISEPLCPSALKEEDAAAKVRQIAKGDV